MPNLSALSRGTQLLAAAGVLLLIDTFLDWQSIDVGPFSVGENAWSGFWGIIMGLALIVLLAWVAARIFEVNLPAELPEGLISVGLGLLVFVFALLKNLIDDYSTIWSYIGVVLAAGVAFGAWLRYQETGGTVDALRSSLPARQTATTAPAATTTEATPAVPGAPAEPMPRDAPPTEPAQPMPPPTGTTTPPPPATADSDEDERTPDSRPGSQS